MSRALDDELTFVLLERDPAAPVAIRAWVEARIRLGKNKPGDRQIYEALKCADSMDVGRPFCQSAVAVAKLLPSVEEKIRIREIPDITVEADPLGISQHTPGAKLDAGKNRLGLIFDGFAHALEHVGRVGTYGANKYTDNGWKQVPNGFARYSDAMYRHLLAENDGIHDKDTGILHAAHAAWNALARLELLIASKEYAASQANGLRGVINWGNGEVTSSTGDPLQTPTPPEEGPR